MSNNVLVSTGLKIDSPLFNELVNKTTELMKISIIQAVMDEYNSKRTVNKKLDPKFQKINIRQEKTVGTVVANRFKKLTPETKNIVIKNIKGLKTTQPKIIDNIKSSGINVVKGSSVFNQIDITKEYHFLSSKDRFDQILEEAREAAERFEHGGHGGTGSSGNDTNNTDTGTTGPSEPAQPVILNKGLKFKIHSVKCIDETDPEWWGADEIAMGGVTLDDKSAQEIISEFEVYNDFDDGDVKTYNPPKILKQFNMDSVYPKTYSVFVALAEKDEGGFSDFLSALYTAIKTELQVILTALGAAAGAAIGAEIGGSVGTAVGGPIGTIIGVAAGLIIGALIGWLVDALKDDIFPTQMATAFLTAGDSTFDNNSLVSNVMSLIFESNDGKYQVDYSWEIIR